MVGAALLKWHHFGGSAVGNMFFAGSWAANGREVLGGTHILATLMCHRCVSAIFPVAHSSIQLIEHFLHLPNIANDVGHLLSILATQAPKDFHVDSARLHVSRLYKRMFRF